MKIVLLFMVTMMLFFLYLVPLIWSFATDWNHGFIAAPYLGWYAMVFVLTLEWGDIILKKGCWFFQK